MVVDWIAFTAADVERDLAWFAAGRESATTGQYIFISSASAYQKPPVAPDDHGVDAARQPLLGVLAQQDRLRGALMQAHRATGFPMTIVRPSHTYDTIVPVAVGKLRLHHHRPHPARQAGHHPRRGDVALDADPRRRLRARLRRACCGNPRAIGHAFHITSDEWLTWDQILRLVGRAAGAEPNIVHVPSEFIAKLDPDTGAGLLGDKSWCALFDNSKMKSFVPGWHARDPVRRGDPADRRLVRRRPARQAVDQAADARVDEILSAWRR